jgi:ribulose-phosphate 3-epimerase
MVCQALKPMPKRRGTAVPIDVHLMIQPVDALAAAFADAGADLISFHPDASGPCAPQRAGHPGKGCQAGLVFNPADAAGCAGLGDRRHRPDPDHEREPRLWRPELHRQRPAQDRAARKRIDASGRDIRLEVDGGIKADNIRRVADAGADTFVAGSAIFGKPDYKGGDRRHARGAAR